MNIKDFIFQQPEFNDCTFCKTFGLSNNCPIKNKYKNTENPEAEEINNNYEECKKYVLSNVIKLLK